MIALKTNSEALFISLNPYCNGIYLMIVAVFNDREDFLGLNPYCNGIYLMIQAFELLRGIYKVLILIVMEYT